jgi:hypothetical protein
MKTEYRVLKNEVDTRLKLVNIALASRLNNLEVFDPLLNHVRPAATSLIH